jgi:cytochrome P450
MLLTSSHPEVAEKVHNEHDRLMGEGYDGVAHKLSVKPIVLQSLKFTRAVIHETLRLFPVGFGVRKADRGATIADACRAWPLDDMVVTLNIQDVNYSERHFSQPAKFIPERWLDPERKITPRRLQGFGQQPSGCPGQMLAEMEISVLLVMAMRDFKYQCVGIKRNAFSRAKYTDLDTSFGDVVFQKFGMSAKPGGRIAVKVEKRCTSRTRSLNGERARLNAITQR